MPTGAKKDRRQKQRNAQTTGAFVTPANAAQKPSFIAYFSFPKNIPIAADSNREG
jgi:hypothetical protein